MVINGCSSQCLLNIICQEAIIQTVFKALSTSTPLLTPSSTPSSMPSTTKTPDFKVKMGDDDFCNTFKCHITTNDEDICKNYYKSNDDIDYHLFCDLTNVSFIHVKAHTGKDDIHSIGNAEADRLATLPFPKFVIPNRIYLNVAYEKKDMAKQLDCKWDVNKKKWYIYDDNKKKDIIMNLFE